MIIWGRTQDWYTWPKAKIGWRPKGQIGSSLPMDDDSLILFVSYINRMLNKPHFYFIIYTQCTVKLRSLMVLFILANT